MHGSRQLSERAAPHGHVSAALGGAAVLCLLGALVTVAVAAIAQKVAEAVARVRVASLGGPSVPGPRPPHDPRGRSTSHLCRSLPWDRRAQQLRANDRGNPRFSPLSSSQQM
jgi:hypothetical protein